MIEPFTSHEPVLVYFDTERVTTPAEVCGTCSDEDDGVWVPVTSCPKAAADQLPEGAPCPNVMVAASAYAGEGR